MNKYFQSKAAMVWFFAAIAIGEFFWWVRDGNEATAFMLGVGITWLVLAKDKRS